MRGLCLEVIRVLKNILTSIEDDLAGKLKIKLDE